MFIEKSNQRDIKKILYRENQNTYNDEKLAEKVVNVSDKRYWHNYNEVPNEGKDILVYNATDNAWTHYTPKTLIGIQLRKMSSWIYVEDVFNLSNYIKPVINVDSIFSITINALNVNTSYQTIKQIYNFNNAIDIAIQIDNSYGQVVLPKEIESIATVIKDGFHIIKNYKKSPK